MFFNLQLYENNSDVFFLDVIFQSVQNFHNTAQPVNGEHKKKTLQNPSHSPPKKSGIFFVIYEKQKDFTTLVLVS